MNTWRLYRFAAPHQTGQPRRSTSQLASRHVYLPSFAASETELEFPPAVVVRLVEDGSEPGRCEGGQSPGVSAQVWPERTPGG